MSVEDSLACQNIELFEATPEEASQFSQQGKTIVAKQVGLRCIHCSKKIPVAESSTVFPDSLGAIAAGVRMVADNHMVVCEGVPPEVRESCNRAARKRAQQQGGEGNVEDSGNDRDEMAIVGYCVEFCQRVGVGNKQPHKSGIEFAEGMEMLIYPPAATPVAPRGLSGPFSADRMGPPMSMERMPFRTPGALASLPRGGPMMGGPAGPEGIAPTPLQSRRDREGQGAGQSVYPNAEREAAASSAGFPTPYQQGMSGGDYGAGMQTPAQPNYEGQDSTPYPPSARTEGSPQGYQDTPQFELPQNFPFYQESNGTWHCKFCSHVHPQYRDPHSIWSSPNGGPPPGNFIDEHLSICRAYYQSIASPQMYQGPPGSYGAPMQMGMYGPPPGAYDNFQYSGQPPFPFPRHPDMRYPTEDYGGQRQVRGVSGHGMPPSHAGGAQQVQGKENSAEAIRLCINHLVAKESEYIARNPESAKTTRLVLDEDRLLLTDYFFYLMKQLRLCRFSESDRKTRGGKREKIKIGYGGLQCVHCADVANSRKFFWSNVDRLANSFAEIPGHVLKCRRCPQQTKDALLQLKQFHPEQMARLPRGSQKVFFRRMWRRLHDDDPENKAIGATASNEENISPEKSQPETPEGKAIETSKEAVTSPVGSPSSPTNVRLQRSKKEAAKILFESASQTGQISPASRVSLAIPEDKEWLSDMDCFIRNQLEVFCATAADVETAQTDRKYPIRVGQVGIRCIHCSTAKKGSGAQGQAVAYPFSISGIYESVREFQRLHLENCEHLPVETKNKLTAFKGSSSLSSVLRKYYVLAAKGLGLQDTKDGIQASGETTPISPQSALSISKEESRVLEEVPVKGPSPSNKRRTSSTASTPESGKKRMEAPEESNPPAKKTKPLEETETKAEVSA